MPWLRDPIVRTGGVPPLQAYLERSFQALDSTIILIENRLLQLERLRAIVGIRIRYAWDDTIDTVATPAASGFMKANNANPDLATEFSLSRFDTFGRLALLVGIFDEPISNGFFQFENITRDTRSVYDIDDITVPRENDVLVQVAHIQSLGAPPQQGDLMEAQYWPEGFVP